MQMMMIMMMMIMVVVTDDCILHSLKSMGPATIELELSLLCTLSAHDATDDDEDEDVDLVVDFIQFLTHMFSTKKDIDLASSYLGLLLKVSADLSRSL